MKALTVIQPHATLIMIRVKPYETRSWAAFDWMIGKYVAIHASKSKEDLRICRDAKYRNPLARAGYTNTDELPLGSILGVVKLIESIPAEQAHDKTFGGFEQGRFAWRLEVIEVFPSPIPAKGQLGFWNWDFKRELIKQGQG